MESKLALEILKEYPPEEVGASDDILLIDCPYCGNQSYYDGGFTCGCEHCGNRIDDLSNEAYTLSDYWYMQAESEYRDYGLPEEEPACPHCGKAYEDFSDLGCEYCDRRHPYFGVVP